MIKTSGENARYLREIVSFTREENWMEASSQNKSLQTFRQY